MAVDCHNLLTLLKMSKKIKGNPPTIWKGSKQIKKINRPAISNFAEADLSLAARLLSKFKQIRFNLFPYLQRDGYALTLPINSPPGAQGKRIFIFFSEATHEERGLHKQRLLHDAPRVLEFRDFLENYFSIQGADTLIPTFFLRNLRNQARRNS